MAQDKKKLVMLLGLVLVLAVLWLRQLMPHKENRSELPLATDANLESVRQFEKIIKNYYKNDISASLSLDTLWLNTKIETPIRNPFTFAPKPMAQADLSLKQRPAAAKPANKPTPVKAAPKPVFKLGGIIYERQRPHAIINATVVQVGDTLAGFRVIAITPSTVQLAGEQGSVLLTLPEEK